MNGPGYILSEFYTIYNEKVNGGPSLCFQQIKKRKPTADDFSHYVTASAVASSQIEGNTLNLNSFINARHLKRNKEVIEIENLIEAYQYARLHKFTPEGLMHCHELLSSSFSDISKTQKGRFRKTRVGITSYSGLVYVAVEPEFVKQECEKLFSDIALLLKKKLTFKQTLYYAALAHFLFAKIHPFADGNGRAARLLEKWFLADKLGLAAWSIPSEKYYWDNRPAYYENLNIGVNYYETLEKLNKVIPFLQMLPKAVCYKPKD